MESTSAVEWAESTSRVWVEMAASCFPGNGSVKELGVECAGGGDVGERRGELDWASERGELDWASEGGGGDRRGELAWASDSSLTAFSNSLCFFSLSLCRFFLSLLSCVGVFFLLSQLFPSLPCFPSTPPRSLGGPTLYSRERSCIVQHTVTSGLTCSSHWIIEEHSLILQRVLDTCLDGLELLR